jgi:hypothetical protein
MFCLKKIMFPNFGHFYRIYTLVIGCLRSIGLSWMYGNVAPAMWSHHIASLATHLVAGDRSSTEIN